MKPRRHAEIRKHNDTYFLADLDSSNGTFLNNSRISEAELKLETVSRLDDSFSVFPGWSGHLSPTNVEIVGAESGNDGSRIIAAVLTNWGQIFRRFLKMTRKSLACSGPKQP